MSDEPKTVYEDHAEIMAQAEKARRPQLTQEGNFVKHCNSCQFFDRHPTRTEFTIGDGLCRRECPKIGAESETLWPSVSSLDWCGQYEDDPNKNDTRL